MLQRSFLVASDDKAHISLTEGHVCEYETTEIIHFTFIDSFETPRLTGFQ